MHPSIFFRTCDVDGDGYLSTAELQGMLHYLDIDIDGREVHSILALLDRDRDGRVSLGEWTATFDLSVEVH